MQIQRLAVVSRDETEVLGYQLQVTATKEEWEILREWAEIVGYALVYWERNRDFVISNELKTINGLLMETIRG